MPHTTHRFIFLFLFTAGCLFSQNTVKWSLGPELPKEAHPVGGAFTGSHDGALILAGGSYYPEGPPWKGGARAFTDAVHVLIRNGAGEWAWIANAGKLPSPRGYGASVSLAEGLLCIGGCDKDKVLPDVTLLSYNKSTQKVTSAKWPALDTPLMMCAGAFLGGKVYVFGGQETLTGEPTSRAKSLDTALEKTAPEFQWQPAPAWDGAARVLPVVLTQNDAEGPAIWLFSGRGKVEDGTFQTLTDAWKFKPATGVWKKLPDMTVPDQGPRGVVGGSAAAYGAHILVFGGDDGLLTRISELMSSRILYTEAEQAAWKKLTETLLENHPGYTSEVLAFDVVGEKWGVATSAPQPLPVTNTAVRSGDEYLLLSGESKPGVRSPQVVISSWPPLSTAETTEPVPKATAVPEPGSDETPAEEPAPPDSVPAPSGTGL